MPEVRISFAENVPSPDYKSKRFSIELSDNVADPASIPHRAQALFEMAKKEIAEQIALAKGKPTAVPSQNANPAPVATAGGTGYPKDRLASPRQISAVFAIAKTVNMSREDVERFTGVSLSAKTLRFEDASKVIQYLKAQQLRQAA